MEDLRNKAFVHIIESPGDEDLLDGRTEGNALTSALELAGIQYCYNLVTTKKSLKIALAQGLFNAIAEKNMFPILHFSMHGNSNEIGLTDKSTIKWDELCQLIKHIQEYLSCFSCGLLICTSSCYGSFASQMAAVQKGIIPFKFLVGTKDEVDWHDAAVAYITFYHLFFKGFDLNHCVKIMKQASNHFSFDNSSGEKVQLKWEENQKQLIIQKAEEVLENLRRYQKST